MKRKPDPSGKRIGILSFPNSVSHGAALQMFALYETVLSLGGCPEILNYYSPYMQKRRHTESAHQGLLRTAIFGAVRSIVHWRAILGFRRFEARMVHMPKKPFGSKAYLEKIAPKYWAIISGSDQVWNPDITDYDLSYFLDFCDYRTKRIAYAPSFGFIDFPVEYDEAIANELKQFDAVSVREMQGVEKVKALIGREPCLVLDPTFLIPRTKWEAIEIQCKTPEQYILYYAIHRSDEMIQFCNKLSAKTGIPIVVAGGNSISKKGPFGELAHYIPDTDPLQWLYLISHANYVVTNSFHGLSFSVIFRKNFFLDLSSQTNARLENLVAMLGLERQIIRKGMTPVLTDYTAAEVVLETMTDSSLDYLRQALRDV